LRYHPISCMAAVLALLISQTAFAADQPERSPDTLAEAHQALNTLLTETERASIKAGSEDDTIRDHMFLHLWIQTTWLQHGKGELAAVLWKAGLRQTDDMADIVLQSYWCHLSGRAIRLVPLRPHFEQYWQGPRSERTGAATAYVKVCS
jgi:hypothetical protein